MEFSQHSVRTVLALDATGSMGGILGKIVTILKETFKRTYEVLKVENQNINVEVKIIIYRSYNSYSEEIMKSTPFQSKWEKLSSFLSTVSASGGGTLESEAIEVCLQSINELENVEQIILIGDAGYNSEDIIKQFRKYFRGEDYWNRNGFPITNALIEL